MSAPRSQEEGRAPRSQEEWSRADSPEGRLPRPFDAEWGTGRRPAAQALWSFHAALTTPSLPVDPDDRAAVETLFDDERARAEAGEPLYVVPEPVWTAAYAACRDHDLDRELLGAQVEAARKFVGPARFETASTLDTFIRLWAASHARLLAGLAGLQYSTQRKRVDEFARGFFLLGRLRRLPNDLTADRLFLPMEDLRWADVSVAQLRDGAVTEGMRRLLWKQSVRVRDALAQGQPLINDLSFRRRYALKYYWMGALALLNELERRDYDLWSEPLGLSWIRRLQVWLQVVFGRTSPR